MKKQYLNLTQNDINEKLIDACSQGDIKLVKYLISSSELQIKAEIFPSVFVTTNSCVKAAAMNNHIEIVKLLMQWSNALKPDGRSATDISYEITDLIFDLFKTKKEKLITYLLDYNDEANQIKINKNELLVNACATNKTDIVKYLLEANMANIHYRNDRPLEYACRNGNIEIVEYLLTSTNIIEKADILNINQSNWLFILENEDEKIWDYLIYSKLENLSMVIPLIKKYPKINKILEKNQLLNKLNNTLIINSTIPKNKI